MRQGLNLTLAFCIAFAICSSGCNVFKKQNTDPALSGGVAGTRQAPERAKPWVKEVSTASYLEDEDDEYLLDQAATDKVTETLRTAIGKGPDQQDAMEMISKADVLFEQAAASKESGGDPKSSGKTFADAAAIYLKAAERWPKSSLEQDALFRAGEGYFFSDNYVDANKAYEKLIARYRGTRYMDAVQARRFTIAKFWLDLNRDSPDNFLTYRLGNGMRPRRDTGGEALRILDKIRLDDPTGKYADDATLALANGYFERKRYLDASDTYEDLRRTFPNSEHQFDAHLFELRSRLQAYQGKDYDGDDLATAEKLLKTMVTQFPNQAEEHRDFLRKEAGRVRLMQAEREMSMASYYDNRGEYRAAEIHYQELARNFSDTPIGETAQARITEITGKPPEPPTRMAWLVNLFPEAEETKPLIGPSAKETLVR